MLQAFADRISGAFSKLERTRNLLQELLGMSDRIVLQEGTGMPERAKKATA